MTKITLAKEFLGRTWCVELRYCEIPWANNPPLHALVDLDGSEPKLLQTSALPNAQFLYAESRDEQSIENLHQVTRFSFKLELAETSLLKN